ncbi:hypothetical protein Bpfe_014228 [Biomphalaria pfeifferi]|uniref:Uncharacterized protein n=1 Tax=Biomphalaria pfeifferi TaxID=112525 RepID=A0AAD8FAA2_BIOPF|nr:hypothetical protein Bpfe_014228 [Biomphalaria pfeifferi]
MVKHHIEMVKHHIQAVKHHIEMVKYHIEMVKYHIEMVKHRIQMVKHHIQIDGQASQCSSQKQSGYQCISSLFSDSMRSGLQPKDTHRDVARNLPSFETRGA